MPVNKQGPVPGLLKPCRGSPPPRLPQSRIVTPVQQRQQKQELRRDEDAKVSVTFRCRSEGDSRN